MNITCVIVDDEKLARDLLQEYLQQMPNIQVLGECSKGKEAVETIDRLKPDLVFLDMVMEHMTGMEVLTKLLQMDPKARVIVATADIQSGTRKESEQKGALEVINEPFTRDRVLSALQNVLEGEKPCN